MNYKSVSPIIASTLLVLITIAIATASYYWMVNVQGLIQADAEGTIGQGSANNLRDFTIVSASCDSVSNTVNVTILNDGVGDIESGSAVFILKSVSGVELATLINSSFLGLPQGAAQTLYFSIDYSLQSSTLYYATLSLSNAKSAKSRSCQAQ